MNVRYLILKLILFTVFVSYHSSTIRVWINFSRVCTKFVSLVDYLCSTLQYTSYKRAVGSLLDSPNVSE